MEIVEAALKADLAHVFGNEAQFLAEFVWAGRAAGVDRKQADIERAERFCARDENIAVTAIDIARAFHLGLFVAGDRHQRAKPVEGIGQVQVGAPLAQALRGIAIDADMLGIEAVDEFIAAWLENAGAKHARGAREIAPMYVQQALEIPAFIGEQDAAGKIAIPFQLAVGDVERAGAVVMHPVVAALQQAGDAHAPPAPERPADRYFGVHGTVRAGTQAGMPAEDIARLDAVQLDDAGRSVATEQRPLRSAQDFDRSKVEHRE